MRVATLIGECIMKINPAPLTSVQHQPTTPPAKAARADIAADQSANETPFGKLVSTYAHLLNAKKTDSDN